jgi:hypothetical protein
MNVKDLARRPGGQTVLVATRNIPSDKIMAGISRVAASHELARRRPECFAPVESAAGMSAIRARMAGSDHRLSRKKRVEPSWFLPQEPETR